MPVIAHAEGAPDTRRMPSARAMATSLLNRAFRFDDLRGTSAHVVFSSLL